MILGHIGVRAGSKGVKNKNMRMLMGQPLLHYSLDQLLQHPLIDAVVLSTDGPDMYAFGQERGTLDIGLRPPELASDTASKWDVWRHALDAAEAVLGKAVTHFVDLDATSPLRLPSDITNAIDLFKTERPDMVMSCTPAKKNPYFNLVELDEDGGLQVSKPLPGNVVARQQAPLVYEHAASTYVVAPDYLRRASFLYEGKVIPYVMPAERCIDIDEEEDFDYVEWRMMREAKNAER